MIARRLITSIQHTVRQRQQQLLYSTANEVKNRGAKATELREQFVEFQKTHPRVYLGFELSDEDDTKLFFQKLGRSIRHKLDRFFISEHTPKEFSTDAADLFSRVLYSLEYISHARWNDMKNDLEYEEYLSCNTQYESMKGKLTAAEARVIEPMLKKLNFLWSITLKVESISAIIGQLKEKYRNSYSLPQEDLPMIVGAVEEYLALQQLVQSEKLLIESGESEKVSRKLERNVLADIIYLKQKLIIPELSLKYPALFK